MVAEIGSATASGRSPPASYEAFRSHPLASWIESTFGVREEARSGKLVRQAPRRLQGGMSGEGGLTEDRESAADELAKVTGIDAERCARVLREWLLQGSSLRRTESSRFPIFAFRLHQFLTRGDTVWATLEPEGRRHLEITKKAAKPGEPDKPLFPPRLLSSLRHRLLSDQERDERDGRIAPPPAKTVASTTMARAARATTPTSTSPSTPPGRKPREPFSSIRLPESLKETTARGVERVRPNARKDIPQSIFVDTGGRVVPEGEGMPAALIRHNFLFCLSRKYCSTSEIASMINEKIFPNIQAKHRENVHRYFNRDFYAYYEIDSRERDNARVYRLSNTGYGRALRSLRNLVLGASEQSTIEQTEDLSRRAVELWE